MKTRCNMYHKNVILAQHWSQLEHNSSISCDEVSTLNNQSWLSIHYYVVENWARIPILISLDCVLEGSSSNNFTKVIMEALTTRGGMPRDYIASKLMSFGVDNVNVFQGTKSSVTK